MKFRASVVFALLCLVAVFGTAAAQDATRGGLNVQVVDQTGAVIPGASVKLRSPQGEFSASTDARGQAVFTALTPGFYEVVVETTGFKTATVAAVLVRLNERSGVRVEMEVGTVAQTIEVIGATTGIDLSTTSTGANISDTLLTMAPVDRSVVAPLYLSPGVVSGGGTGVHNPSIAGASGLENLYLIDGVNTTNSGYGGFGNYSINFGSLGTGVTTSFIKEIQVKTGGMEARYGQALGGVVQMITKSGSNEFHGAVYGYYQPEALQDQRPNPNDFRTAALRTYVRHVEDLDYGVEAGGKLIQDRLFFFAAFNPTVERVGKQAPDAPGFLFGASGASDLGIHEIRERTINYAGKLSYRLNDNHSVDASIFGDPTIRNFGPNRGLIISDPAAFSRLDFSQINWAVRYNGVVTPNWIVSASFGQNHQRFEEQQLTDEYRVTDFRQLDPVTGLIDTSLPFGNFGGVGNKENTTGGADQMWDGSSTHLFTTFGAQNNLTVGFTYEDASYDGIRGRTGPNWPLPSDPRIDPKFVGSEVIGASLDFLGCSATTGSPDCNGLIAPSQLINGEGFYAVQSRGNFSGTAFATAIDYYAVYIQDDLEINKYLTFKLGMRWEQEKMGGGAPGLLIPCTNGFGLDPATGASPFERVEECGYTFTDSWAPRIGFVIDPLGNRRSKIYFNYGRYFERIPLDFVKRQFVPEEGFLNLVFTLDADQVAKLDAAHYLPSTQVCDNGSFAVLCGSTGGAGSTTAVSIEGGPIPSGVFPPAIAVGTKMQFQDEYLVGFEYELPGGIVVGARYQDRRIKRIVEDLQGITTTDFNNGLLAFQFIFANPGPSTDVFENPVIISYTDPATDCSDFAVVDGPGPGLCYTPLSGLYSPGDGLADGFPKVVRDYRAVEITVEKRFTDNWQLMANWRISELKGNFEGSFRNDNGQSDPNLTSIYDFTSSGPNDPLQGQFESGPLPNDRPQVVNIYASYVFNEGAANGLNLGAGWRIQSGTPITQFDAHPGYRNSGELPIGGRGALGRTDVTQTVDVHTDYAFQLTERFRLKAVVDIFNIFNNQRTNLIDQRNQLSGGVPNPDFLQPGSNDDNISGDIFQRPFTSRIALRLEW